MPTSEEKVMNSTKETASKRPKPSWKVPEGTYKTGLKLFNSLTRNNEEFIPQNGKNVLWYSCGPTVYDASHMGHARSYITFDIVRRIMKDLFNYDIHYCMNITDIDDKIIKRGRQRFLLNTFKEQKPSLEVAQQYLTVGLDKIKKTITEKKDEIEEAKLNMLKGIYSKTSPLLQSQSVEDILSGGSDILMDVLDEKVLGENKDDSDEIVKKLGKMLDDEIERECPYSESIFGKLSSQFENEFYKDMNNLNVLPADTITRVSEYVPEVVSYVQKIIDHGYAYESNGSVYFDTGKFASTPNHYYAKLVPEAYGDHKALAEGEGDLSISSDRLKEKRNGNDFALWKASKKGEPFWPSPWGKGRPGWHVECSVMASDILGSSMDIHTGGVDLKFPHHDNELAQAEAYFENDYWVRYFLHSGHLHINGCKMSKSLKNFITIESALEKNSARQLRLLFLVHSWGDTLNYSNDTLQMALNSEKKLNEFFLNIKHQLRQLPMEGVESFTKWHDQEKALNNILISAEEKVYEALCNNIDTKSAMVVIFDLMTDTNKYMDSRKPNLNRQLLENILRFITNILDAFGVNDTKKPLGFGSATCGGIDNLEETLFPYLEAFASFRENVRDIGRNNNIKDLLALCDSIRDRVLPCLGVRFEDHEGEPTVIKLLDKDVLMKEMKAKEELEEKKRKEKEERLEKQRLEAEERDKKNSIPPSEMFKNDSNYSQFDEEGVPTHDSKGEQLTKSSLKNLKKKHATQKKNYEKWLAKQASK